MEEDEESSLNDDGDDMVFDPEMDNKFSDKISKIKRTMPAGNMKSENMDDEDYLPEIASIHESPQKRNSQS